MVRLTCWRMVWTASELLAALTNSVGDSSSESKSPRDCCLYMESHTQELRSLGLDVSLHQGFPRRITLRQFRGDEGTKTVVAHAPVIPLTSDFNAKSLPARHDQKSEQKNLSRAEEESPSQDVSIAGQDPNEQSFIPKFSFGNSIDGRVFENTGEALVAFGEMRELIREQATDAKAALELVVGRTKEMTRACGVAVGMLRHENVVYVAQAGILAPVAARYFKAEIFQSCLDAGEMLQLPDAQQHFLLGADCRREGIRSLVVTPVLHKGNVMGIVELMFAESRSFSLGDIMDIELIAGVVSEVVTRMAQGESEPIEKLEYRSEADDTLDAELVAAKPPIDEGSEENLLEKNSSFPDSPTSISLGGLAKLAGAPARLWVFCRGAWEKRAGPGRFC